MGKWEGDNMELNVAMVSPYDVRCGVATYTEQLNPELSRLGCVVYGIKLPRFGKKNSEILQNVVDAIPIDQIDLIHVQHEYGLYQNLEKSFYRGLETLNKPIVTTLHSVGAWEVDKIIAAVSTKVIVHNEFCFKRYNHSNAGIIPHGCQILKEPSPPKEECKKSLGIDPRTPLVGYLGFISSYKGLETLIDAMVNVPKAGLLIAGGWHSGEGTEYIFNLKEHTLNVLPSRCKWLGYVSDKDLSRVYGAMDLVVYPSRFATESGALLQALSHGKAVIANRLYPFKEKEKLGALQTFKNTKQLTQKIKNLLNNVELRQNLENGAKKYCEINSWTNIAEKHVKLYEQVLNP